MPRDTPRTNLSSVVRQKPLQTAKFGGILFSLVLGIAGFFRIIDAKAILPDPLLGDGQFLALILIPVVSLLLIFVVFLETLVTGYRFLQSDQSLPDQLTGRSSYILLRGTEAAIALGSVTIMFIAFPALIAESTPAPAGVGVMLLLMGMGSGMLLTSLIRSSAELFVYRSGATR